MLKYCFLHQFHNRQTYLKLEKLVICLEIKMKTTRWPGLHQKHIVTDILGPKMSEEAYWDCFLFPSHKHIYLWFFLKIWQIIWGVSCAATRILEHITVFFVQGLLCLYGYWGGFLYSAFVCLQVGAVVRWPSDPIAFRDDGRVGPVATSKIRVCSN
jgi:hypothetical protein